MDLLPPPPPYSETDIYSNSGASNTSTPTVLTPTASNADDASTIPISDYAPSSADGSTIFTPPYTPDGSCHMNGSGIPDNLGDNAQSTAAAAYFASRPVYQQSEDLLLLHTVIVTAYTEPQDLPFPQPEDLWLERNVTKQDWATFLNYLLPHHTDTNNSDVADRKLKAELVEERMQRLTLNEGDSHVDLDHVDAQLDPLRQVTAPNRFQPSDIEIVIAEWNQGFFSPRSLHVDVELVPLEEAPRTMPGAWTEHPADTQGSQSQGSSRGGPSGRGFGQWIRADNSGFHMGKSFMSADTNGFRMGNHGLVADTNGFRIGNLLVADSNGFRLGSMVADSKGFRIGNHSFGSAPIPPAVVTESQRGRRDHRTGRRGSRGRFPDREGEGRTRSNSTSSLSSEASEASEASIGSLPDYDTLAPTQLPVLKQALQNWLDHPDQPTTKESVKAIKTELKTVKSNAKTSPTPDLDVKKLKGEIKGMLTEFKAMKRAQKQEHRAKKKERKAFRHAARQERRAARKAARRETKGKYRTDAPFLQPPPVPDNTIPGLTAPNVPGAWPFMGGFLSSPRGRGFGPSFAPRGCGPPCAPQGRGFMPGGFPGMGWGVGVPRDVFSPPTMSAPAMSATTARAQANANRMLADASRMLADVNQKRAQANLPWVDEKTRLKLMYSADSLEEEAVAVRKEGERLLAEAEAEAGDVPTSLERERERERSGENIDPGFGKQESGVWHG